MEQYDATSEAAAQVVTKAYSSSFGLATRAFPAFMRHHIYNIYGLVRIADEVVDTFKGDDKVAQLAELEKEVGRSLKTGFSSNLIVHAFQLTARECAITDTLVAPFFNSMRMDVDKRSYSQQEYAEYIHGSAEVVGLMCLKVFTRGDQQEYERLKPGAIALGAAFQKVNFLRDLAQDYRQLGRFYFPGYSYESFDETAKQAVVADICKDFAAAKKYLDQLPNGSRPPVTAAFRYYYTLLQKLEVAPVTKIKQQRLRLTDAHKLTILVSTLGNPLDRSARKV